MYIIDGDYMRKYYLFNIKSELNRIFRHNPYGLYKTIEDLYDIKRIKYEVALYNELCDLIDSSSIKYYIENTFNYNKNKDKYLLGNTLIEVNRSCVVVESEYNIPDIFKTLGIYSKNFLVIDFYNNDYFWLNKFI